MLGSRFSKIKGKGDEQEVQTYLQVLLPLIQDQQLRHQVSDRARQRIVESFNLVNMADQIEAIFAEAITLRQASPKVDVDRAIAEEMLLVALEYLHQEQVLSKLWQEKCGLERESDQLQKEKSGLKEESDQLQQDLKKERDQLQQEKYGWERESNRLETERYELVWKKRAMESSKFWQLRKQWFKLKRLLRLTQEEEI